jgi:hypothetical protein
MECQALGRKLGLAVGTTLAFTSEGPGPSALRTVVLLVVPELIWDGEYDKYGNRRSVEAAGLAIPTQHIDSAMRGSATREDGVDDLFRLGVFVDLYGVVRQAMRISIESYSLKKLEPLTG